LRDQARGPAGYAANMTFGRNTSDIGRGA